MKLVSKLEKQAEGKTLGVQASKACQRPDDYFELSGEAQWAVDKALGILDWDGSWNE